MNIVGGKPQRKFEDYNKEAVDAFGSEQEWSVEGAQITLQKVLQPTDTQTEPSVNTSVIQQLSLGSAQTSNYSFGVVNQFRQGHVVGRLDSMGSVVGIIQQQFGPVDALLQWTKRAGFPTDVFMSSDLAHHSEGGGVLSFKLMKGAEASLAYLKSFGKRFSIGTELKYQFPLRKTFTSFVFRYKSSDKMNVITGEVDSNKDFKIDVLRKLHPMGSLVVELAHKNDKSDTNVRVGSQIHFAGQSNVRIQVDPQLRVKAMATTTIGRSCLLSMLFQWDPKTRTFRQGLDVKTQGATLL
jgi:hypothetical protein